jgi:hypothetical protein
VKIFPAKYVPLMNHSAKKCTGKEYSTFIKSYFSDEFSGEKYSSIDAKIVPANNFQWKIVRTKIVPTKNTLTNHFLAENYPSEEFFDEVCSGEEFSEKKFW